MEQLDLMFKLCGSPVPVDWPEVELLPWYESTFSLILPQLF
jgi:hypothetical protein